MKQQQRKALFVGIDDYENGITALSCACKDADDLHDFFEKHGYEVKIQRNGRTDEILKAIKNQLKELTSKDMFLFFFAGHGYTIQDKNGELDRCLAGQTDMPDRIQEGRDGISLREVRKLVEKHAKCACVVIIDACQTKAGGDRAFGDVLDEPCTSRDLLAISEIVNSKPEHDTTAPFVVINSCAVGEVAYEMRGTSHGLFTSAMLDTLQGIIEQGAGDSAFDNVFVERVAFRMEELCKDLKQHPTLFVSSEPTHEQLRIFPIRPELDKNVAKLLAELEDTKYIELRHFAEDVMLRKCDFKYAKVLRNLLRLFGLPEFNKVIKSQYGAEIKPEDSADVIEAFYEMKELMTKPRQVLAEQNMMPLREPKMIAKSGLPLSLRDKNLLADLEARLKKSDGRLPRINGVAKKNLSDIGRMSQSDAVSALDVLARERMRELCGREDRNWLYHCRERNCWHERSEKGLLVSDFERAIYRFVCDDECLVPETPETFE